MSMKILGTRLMKVWEEIVRLFTVAGDVELGKYENKQVHIEEKRIHRKWKISHNQIRYHRNLTQFLILLM